MNPHDTHGHHGEGTHGEPHGSTIHLPTPTAWPIVLAFGFTLLISGVLLHWGLGVLGALLIVIACVGWFKDIFPHESHIDIPVTVQEVEFTTLRTSVARIRVSSEHRAHLPLESFPITAGIKGGIAGAIAMIIPAEAYGLIVQHSLWYPVNLLGGAGITNWTDTTPASLNAFHAPALGMAIVIHIISSVLVGLLYGAILPMVPRHPVVLGGVFAPVAWTFLLHGTLHTINPEFATHIQWYWFGFSQIIFGVVAGLVVSREEHVKTAQTLPFALRLGLEAPGLHGDGDGRDGEHN